MAVTKSWKTNMIQARALRGKAGGVTFDRAKLLVSVYDDPDFIAEHGDQLRAMDVLDAEVSDLGFDFADLMNMLQCFPDRKVWEKKHLKTMQAEMLELAKNSKVQTITDAPPRRTATVKQLDDAEKRAEKGEVRVESLSDELAELKQENSDLRMQLSEANGRIMELERLIKVEPIEV